MAVVQGGCSCLSATLSIYYLYELRSVVRVVVPQSASLLVELQCYGHALVDILASPSLLVEDGQTLRCLVVVSKSLLVEDEQALWCLVVVSTSSLVEDRECQ